METEAQDEEEIERRFEFRSLSFQPTLFALCSQKGVWRQFVHGGGFLSKTCFHVRGVESKPEFQNLVLLASLLV